MATERLIIDNASFGYSGHSGEKVFENISFSAEKGGVVCLLGPNGTGKSTVLKCLNNILKVQSGRVFINGKDISGMSRWEVARLTGYVPQSLTSVFPFTIRDIVVMGRATRISMFSSPSRLDIRVAEEAMERTGISHLADRRCTDISGGEWQLTLIARSLTQKPDILLLDEPTSHLDLGNQVKIIEVIGQLAEEGMAIIMATHFPDHAFISAGRVVLLKDRRILAKGSPDEVITADNMKNVYGVNVTIMNVDKGGNRKVCIPVLNGDIK